METIWLPNEIEKYEVYDRGGGLVVSIAQSLVNWKHLNRYVRGNFFLFVKKKIVNFKITNTRSFVENMRIQPSLISCF